ncbi:MAG: stage III sporulation protein AD [Clostridium sp.]|jgi:stage III sporulation protein AD|nr:stage III sporulation protein AD [Clostridium sp.]
MTEVVKVGILGMAGVLVAVQLRAEKKEYGIYIGVAVGILIFGYALRQFEAVLGQFERLKTYLGAGESYLSVLLKVIGITYICEFSAGICKDAGYGTISEQIEILGKLSVMFAGLPILFAVIEQLQSFMS